MKAESSLRLESQITQPGGRRRLTWGANVAVLGSLFDPLAHLEEKNRHRRAPEHFLGHAPEEETPNP